MLEKTKSCRYFNKLYAFPRFLRIYPYQLRGQYSFIDN